ncbi:hypothetical protein BH09MYX1_BH09MYX1_22950 [soil metagenome]
MDIDDFIDPRYLVPLLVVLMVLGGIAFAVMRSIIGKKRLQATPAWARGAYSIWTGGEDSGTWDAQRAATSLQNWYGATNAQSFWNVVNELRQGQSGNVAWDQVRALDLLRIAAAARWIDEEKCFVECGGIGRYLQGKFQSWEELAAAFEAGMKEWHRVRNVRDPQELNRVQRNLPTLRTQIWPKVPFKMPLAAEED